MTATEKKYTDKLKLKKIQGVLFLAAGYGTRAEPLSFLRPKALLPYRETNLLGNLINQFTKFSPDSILVNTSRCPQLIAETVLKYWQGNTKILFEEKPLGTPGTLARNRDLLRGTWVLSNTDIAIDLPVEQMLEYHFEKKSDWTVLTGKFPEYGNYGTLSINGKSKHYLGVSIISDKIVEIASKQQLSFGFFSVLRKYVENAGIRLNEFFTDREWLDMGEVDLYRKHLLKNSRYIHQNAQIHTQAILDGCYWIGNSCIIEQDAYIYDSVVMENSVVKAGVSVVNSVVPWFTKRG